MLRTSLRTPDLAWSGWRRRRFLSSNAQDFIEERACTRLEIPQKQFLSSNAQDFIEDSQNRRDRYDVSINS